MILDQDTQTTTHRVICADDDPITRKMYEYIFTRNGYSTVVVDSGEDAISCFVEAPRDIVVLDVEMHGMSGIEVSRVLRGLNAGRYVPIIIMSGSSSEAEFEHAKSVGISAFMSKPLQPEKLIAKCNFLIKRHELLKHFLADAKAEADVVRQLLCPGMDMQDFGVKESVNTNIKD